MFASCIRAGAISWTGHCSNISNIFLVFQVLTSRTIHNTGAYLMFMAAVIYMILQTGLTCCLCPEYNTKFMVGFRFFLCITAIFAVIFSILSLLFYSQNNVQDTQLKQ